MVSRAMQYKFEREFGKSQNNLDIFIAINFNAQCHLNRIEFSLMPLESQSDYEICCRIEQCIALEIGEAATLNLFLSCSVPSVH